MSYTRNSRHRGVFASAGALPTAPIEQGSTAYVNDSAGLPGGSAGVPGHVRWDGSSWVVFDLDSETPNSATPSATASVNLSGALNRNIQVNVNVAPGANAIEVAGGGLRVTDCTIGSVVTATTAASAVSALVLDASGCVRSVPLTTLELRDCSGALIATFRVMQV